MALTHGSLFTGIGMIDYGLELAGFQTSWMVEINPYCQRVLERHWPDVPRFDDVKKCGIENGINIGILGRVDLISGGFPCTDISGAQPHNRKLGIGTPDKPTARSGLWYEYRRIVQELRPTWVLVENVARLLHSRDNADRVIAEMEEAGYACGALLLGSSVFGTPHERRRAWLLFRNHDSHGDGNPGDGLEAGVLPADLQREIEEKGEIGRDWQRELGTGDACEEDTTEESEAAAYGGDLRGIHDDPTWVDRIRCCGNSVNWVVPALIGCYIAEVEKRKRGKIMITPTAEQTAAALADIAPAAAAGQETEQVYAGPTGPAEKELERRHKLSVSGKARWEARRQAEAEEMANTDLSDVVADILAKKAAVVAAYDGKKALLDQECLLATRKFDIAVAKLRA